MIKIKKIFSVSFSIVYLLFIFIVILRNEQITQSFYLPNWLIPTIFIINFGIVSIKYIIFLLKEDKLEQEIIAIINHTFRTPLTSILWHTRELKNDMPQNQKFLYLQNINNSADKLLKTVEVLVGIKSVNDRSGYLFEAISIRDIVEKSIKKYREKINKKNITFQVPTFSNTPLLSMDLNKISFVIDTVLENAISYNKQDGKILIDCISNSKKIVLFVSDTGIGLSKIDKAMIFKRFFRGKQAKLMDPNGTGLKLYLAKIIIKRHHGKIYAKSNGKDEGTTFFIELPFKK